MRNASQAVNRVFRIRGLDCAEEVAILKDVVGPLVGGPDRLSFDILNGKMTVEAGVPPVSDHLIERAIERTGMRATRWSAAVESFTRDSGRRIRALLTTASGAFTLAGFATHAVLAGGLASALGSEGAGLAHDVPAVVRALFAAETADIALMSDDLGKIPWLIEHSRRAVAIVRQNIVMSLVVKLRRQPRPARRRTFEIKSASS